MYFDGAMARLFVYGVSGDVLVISVFDHFLSKILVRDTAAFRSEAG